MQDIRKAGGQRASKARTLLCCSTPALPHAAEEAASDFVVASNANLDKRPSPPPLLPPKKLLLLPRPAFLLLIPSKTPHPVFPARNFEDQDLRPACTNAQ